MSKNGQVTNPADHDSPLIRAEFGGGAQRMRQDIGPLVRFQTGLMDHGAKRATESGALEARPDDIVALQEHATAAARDAYRARYEPEANPNDRLREDQFQRVTKRRETVSEQAEHSEVTLRGCEADLARVPDPGPKPQIPVLLIFGAVFVLALTVAPTIRDFLFDGLEDDLIAWGASLFAGVSFGLFLAWSTLSAAGGGSGPDDGEPRRRRGVFGAAGVAIGLGLWRLSGAVGFSDYVTALALTVLELGVVLTLDRFAQLHQARLRDWQARHDDYATAASAATAAAVDLERRRKELLHLEDGVCAHVEYVEDRTLRNLSIDELIRAATTAVRDGYNSGVAANRGRRSGVRR
jgi:hypothetical protein